MGLAKENLEKKPSKHFLYEAFKEAKRLGSICNVIKI